MTEKQGKFRPIAVPLDVDDAALDRVNRQLGVPTLMRPEAGAASISQPPAPTTVPERTPVDKLTIELPTYLADALRREAVAHRTTARHLVMKALRNDGFEVDDADLVPDGRRTRGKAR